MPLSKQDLLKRMREEAGEQRLVVDPYIREIHGGSGSTVPASLDFHLGTRFVFLRRGRDTVHDPVEQADHSEASGTELFIPLGADLYLHPGQLVLATTLEWLKFPGDLMAYVITRSIWGRRGLLVVTASAVQPFSSGRITLELANVGDVAVRVRPGVALGQLFFHSVDDTATDAQKMPPFSVTHKPIFGTYRLSPIEELLLGRTNGKRPLDSKARRDRNRESTPMLSTDPL